MESLRCEIAEQHNSYLQNRNQEMYTQIMELKKETPHNQKLQQENQDLKKKFDNSLLEKGEEISRLKDCWFSYSNT